MTAVSLVTEVTKRTLLTVNTAMTIITVETLRYVIRNDLTSVDRARYGATFDQM